jgi:hypothetical protein
MTLALVALGLFVAGFACGYYIGETCEHDHDHD